MYAVWGYDANGNGTPDVYEEDVPDTGDADNLFVWRMMLLIALVAVIALSVRRRVLSREG